MVCLKGGGFSLMDGAHSLNRRFSSSAALDGKAEAGYLKRKSLRLYMGNSCHLVLVLWVELLPDPGGLVPVGHGEPVDVRGHVDGDAVREDELLGKLVHPFEQGQGIPSNQ